MAKDRAWTRGRGPTPRRRTPRAAPPKGKSERPTALPRQPLTIAAMLLVVGSSLLGIPLLERMETTPAIAVGLVVAFNVGAVMLERIPWQTMPQRQMLVTLGGAASGLALAVLLGGVGLLLLGFFGIFLAARLGAGVGSALGLGTGMALSLAGAGGEVLFIGVLSAAWPSLAVGRYFAERAGR